MPKIDFNILAGNSLIGLMRVLFRHVSKKGVMQRALVDFRKLAAFLT
jgi:hypothetical protein